MKLFNCKTILPLAFLLIVGCSKSTDVDIPITSSSEAAKELYKKALIENKLSDKGGAGLGFIDIVKRTEKKLEYQINGINDTISFFVLIIRISKGGKIS